MIKEGCFLKDVEDVMWDSDSRVKYPLAIKFNLLRV